MGKLILVRFIITSSVSSSFISVTLPQREGMRKNEAKKKKRHFFPDVAFVLSLTANSCMIKCLIRIYVLSQGLVFISA